MGTTLTARRVTDPGADDDFTASYRSSLGRLVGYFRAKGVPRDEAADLANETMVRLLVHLKRHGRDRSDLGPLVRTISRNLLIERVRRSAPVMVPLGDDIDVADDELEPIDQLVASERRDAVHAAIASLSPRHRHVVGLWMEGRTPAEIARVLGIKRNAVDAILHRARRSLAAKLDGRGVFGLIAVVGLRIRVVARRIGHAVLSFDPTGQSAPAGLAFATVGMAAVLTFSGPASGVSGTQHVRPVAAPLTGTTLVSHTSTTSAAPALARASVPRVAQQIGYEVPVVAPTRVKNPVTGESSGKAGVTITVEPTGGNPSVVDEIVHPVLVGCAASGHCARR